MNEWMNTSGGWLHIYSVESKSPVILHWRDRHRWNERTSERENERDIYDICFVYLYLYARVLVWRFVRFRFRFRSTLNSGNIRLYIWRGNQWDNNDSSLPSYNDDNGRRSSSPSASFPFSYFIFSVIL